MSSFPPPDLAGLAMLARNGDRELRPVLLKLHTREFVAAALRDRRAVATYEALALGLIPLVPDDVIADVSAMLQRVPEAPARVIDLLAARRRARSEPDPRERAAAATLSQAESADLLALGDPAIDLALARNRNAAIDAHGRRELVARAAADRALADALLARPDLSAWERGALFRFVRDRAERDRIREELERAAAASAPNLPALSAWRRARILRAAAKADLPELFGELARALGLGEAPPWNLDDPAEAELFGLALVAAGLAIEDCMRVLLTADPRISASVPAVFRLRQVCRTTSRAAAWQLLAARELPRKPARATGAADPRGRKAEGAPGAVTERARPSPASRASAPAGHRSRSTTGPDRT
ncbi:hypothetical protein [Enterovirga aerilata]|uniref:DUF2336 domain-containing protein n=1 Tax=Enterovirga aerilata TaxID=2730920 RepID=A0A849I4N8_9HYPH|nr:hypothetical protein [Enterovirga sp. DB1703]NNM72664.1 hypothetical protein [Enterovirga sp. DB1703]